MEVKGEVASLVVSQRQLAKALGLSTTRTNQLVAEGILVRDESSETGRLLLLDSLRNYYQSQRSTQEGASFWKERALHEKAKRELAELKVLERRSELIEYAEVERVISEMLTRFKTNLLGLGHKVAGRLEGLEASGRADLIDEEVTTMLEELAADAERLGRMEDDKTELDTAAANDG